MIEKVNPSHPDKVADRIADCMDETVIATLNDKNATQDKLLDALKARIREVKENG